MEEFNLKPRSYEEIHAWLMNAKQRKREWEAKMQVKLAEMEREMEISRKRFASL